MACRLIISPKTGKEVTSKTWDDLYQIYNNNEALADAAYNKMLTPAFTNWFGDWTDPNAKDVSQAVNDLGEPLIMYRGDYGDRTQFPTIIPSIHNEDELRYGIYFTKNPEYANQYAKARSGLFTKPPGKVFPVFLSIKNPQDRERLHDIQFVSPEEASDLQKQGFDSIRVDTEITKQTGYDEYMIFKSSQAKTINNIGSFNSGNPNIYFNRKSAKTMSLPAVMAAYQTHIWNPVTKQLEERIMHPMEARQVVSRLHNDTSFRFKTVTYNNESAVIRVDNTVEQSEANRTNNVDDTKMVNEILSRMPKKFGIDYEIITPDQAIAMLKKKGHDKDISNLESAFFVDGKVYLVEGLFSLEDPIHEYAHPFIMALRNENPELFEKLYNDLISTPDGERILKQVEQLGYDKDMIKEEVLVRAVTEKALDTLDSLKAKSIADRIFRWIKKMLAQVFGIKSTKIDMNTTLQNLAEMLLSDEQINVLSVSDSSNVRFNREAEDHEESDPLWDEMISNQTISSIEQQEVLETLYQMRRNSSLSTDEKAYDIVNPETGDITRAERTSNYISKFKGPAGQVGYYGYDGDPDAYEDNRQWGNQMDDILTAVLRGDTLAQAKDFYLSGLANRPLTGDAKLSTDVIEKLYDVFTKLREEYPDAVILNQQILYNIEAGVAGTADILVVHGNGEVDVLDLKSSVNPTDESYTITLADGTTIETSYTKQFKDKASKKERHRAQLSIYTGLLNANGIRVTGNNKTIHIHILDRAGSVVTDVKRERDKLKPPISDFVNLVSKDKNFIGEPIPDIEKSSDLFRILSKISKTLSEKKAEFAKKGNEAAAYKLKSILEDIRTTNFGGAMAIMIEETTSTMLGKGNWKGWLKKIADDIKLFEEGQINAADAVKKLADAKEQLELYLPVIQMMKDFKERFEYTDQGEPIPLQADPESPLAKMRMLINNINTYKSMINRTMPQAQAAVLFPYLEPATKRLKAEYRAKRDAAERYRTETKARGYSEESKRYKKRQSIQDKLDKETAEMYRRSHLTVEELAEMLREGNYANLRNVFDIYVNPAISSSNEIVAAVALATKDNFEIARRQSLDAQHTIIDAFEKFKNESGRKRDNVEEFNDGLYKTVRIFTGEFDKENQPIFREEIHFVNEYDITKYEEAKAEMERGILEADNKTKGQTRRDFYQRHRVNKPTSNVAINMPNGSRVIIEYGTDHILAQKKRLMSEAQFNKWLKLNSFTKDGIVYYTTPELTKPNPAFYSDTEYQNLTGPLKEYRDFLVGTYFKAQEKLPSFRQPGMRVPSIVKTDMDRWKEESGTKKLFQYLKSDFSRIRPEDEDVHGEDGSKAIPVLYTNKRMDINDISVDLVSSVLRFVDAANLYEARSTIAPVADSVLEQMKVEAPIKLTDSGQRSVSKFAKALGLGDTFAKWNKDYGDNNVAKLLAGFIEMQIYGKYKKKEPWLGMDMGKIADSLIKYGSITQIGLDPILGAANWLNAKVVSRIEAHANQFYNNDEWQKGLSRYRKLVMDGVFMKDFTQPFDKSVYGQLIDIYDAVQGTARDKFGRKVSQSAAKKLWSSDTYYFNMAQGEHHIQTSSFFAMMFREKAIDNLGNEQPLLEAYEKHPETGKLKIKDGWSIDHLGSVSEDGLVVTDVQNRLHSINKSLHGVYNTFDKVLLEQHAVGRLLMMYRKFIVPGFKRRWQSYSVNYEAGEAREGYYNTFWKLMKRDWMETAKHMIPFVKASELGLTPLELMNLRRASFEFGSILALILSIQILRAIIDNLGDDDEREKWALSYPLYLSTRLQSEMLYYSNPSDLTRSFRAPTATYSIWEKSWKLFSNVLFQDIPGVLTGSGLTRYEQDTAIADKGDSKSLIYLYKLFGFNGRTQDPREAQKILDMTTGR